MDKRELLENYNERGFAAKWFDSPAPLLEALQKMTDKDTTVGLGGSATLRQLGIPELLKKLGVPTLDHWDPALSKEQEWETRLAQGRCDLFITSANACTRDGRLFLVDGVGNRVAAAVFGPKAVLFVIGANKIVPGIHEAGERIRNIAGPKRAASLNLQTPCVKAGKCQDCRSPNRICRAKLILDAPPMATPTRVWFLEGDYGY